MKSPVVREADGADWPAVAALLDSAFGPQPFEVRERLWRWRQYGNPASTKSFPAFLVADRDGEIVGAHGLLPLRLHVDGSDVLAACACDFAVDTSARGVGLALKLKAMDAAYAPVAISTSANERANKVMLALKGRQLDAGAVTWLKPLRAAGLLARRPKSATVQRVIGAGLAFPDLALKWSRGVRRRFATGGPAVERVERFGSMHDELWQRVKQRGGVLLIRDADYLRWRYTDYPFGGVGAYQVVDGSSIRGLAVLHQTRDAEGLVFTAVLELYDDAGDVEVLGALLRSVVAEADRRGSHYVTAKASAPAHTSAYRAAGFLERRSDYSPFTYFTREPRLAAALDRSEAWTIALGDGDFAYYFPSATA